MTIGLFPTGGKLVSRLKKSLPVPDPRDFFF
jgi:hypothetical protein